MCLDLEFWLRFEIGLTFLFLSEAELYLYGGCVTSWKVGNKDLLFVRPDAVFNGQKPIRLILFLSYMFLMIFRWHICLIYGLGIVEGSHIASHNLDLVQCNRYVNYFILHIKFAGVFFVE